jgi:exopolysaccharide production protein ExoQ
MQLNEKFRLYTSMNMLIDKKIWKTRILTAYLYYITIVMFFVLVGSRSIWLLSVLFLLPFCLNNIHTLGRRLYSSTPMIIILLWCFISSFWSEWTSFTRVETFLQVLILMTTLLISELYSPKTIFTVLKHVAIACILVSLFALILAPSSGLTSFVGVYAGKNTAGQFMAMSILLLLFIKNRQSMITGLIFIGLVLLLLTRSGTAILMFTIAVPIGYFFLNASNRRLTLMHYFLCKVGYFVLFTLFIITYYYHIELLTFIYNNLSEEALTGRGKLWIIMLQHVEDKVLVGFGYAAVWWHGDYSEVYFTELALYGTEWIDKLVGSDSGYVDLVLSIGLIGLFMFLTFLYKTFINLLTIDNKYHRATLISLFFFIILCGITESAFLVPQFALWFLLLLIFCISLTINEKTNYVC